MKEVRTGHGCGQGCPAGEVDCPLLNEVIRLREQCCKLEELSYLDALTGLFNFRHLQRSLEMEIERTRRTRLPTSLIMTDLDHFKSINNTYGHEMGNAALEQTGVILRENIRMIDIACRYGGEEFALVLPSTYLGQATVIAERLRTTINSSPFRMNGDKLFLTASFGVAVYTEMDNWSVSEFLSRADAYLYQAKTMGRNRVCTQKLAPTLPTTGVTREEKEGLFVPHNDDE